jgi:hypothetical protein
MTAAKPVRHRPRSFNNVNFTRCGLPRDLRNAVILSNRGITCPACIALQEKYKMKAKAELEALEAKPRKGPLRKSLAPEPKRRKRILP